jgi:GT2 family glycosyltransferase
LGRRGERTIRTCCGLRSAKRSKRWTLPSRVSAVVGNYQGAEVLGDCLASLERQTLLPLETIVVDAGSTDGSAEQARSRGARVIATENRGIGHLYNVGARAATGEFLLFANNDVALEEACLERLAAALAGHDGRFAADPRQRDWADTRDIHARSILVRAPLLRRPLPGFDLDQTIPAGDVTPTLLANGALFLVSRQRFLDLGGFDENFFMEWEDADLSWRAWARGWEIVYVPQAVARHRVGAVTTASVVPRRLRSSHHNLLRFALKCFPASQAARVVAGELLRLPAHPTLVAPALGRVAVELREILRLRRALGPSRPLFDRLYGPEPPRQPPR